MISDNSANYLISNSHIQVRKTFFAVSNKSFSLIAKFCYTGFINNTSSIGSVKESKSSTN